MPLLATLTILAGLSQPALAIDDQVESMRMETVDGFILKGEFWKPRKKEEVMSSKPKQGKKQNWETYQRLISEFVLPRPRIVHGWDQMGNKTV